MRFFFKQLIYTKVLCKIVVLKKLLYVNNTRTYNYNNFYTKNKLHDVNYTLQTKIYIGVIQFNFI